MKPLYIDIETYSAEDITKAGAYRYAADPDFDVLLLAYAWGDEPVRVCDLTKESLPDDIRQALTDPKIMKCAHNAAFERTCLAQYLMCAMPPEQWCCTMARAAIHGLPLSLDGASKALGLRDKKDAAGKALINYFCKPCKPTKTNGGRTRNLPEHAPEKWAAFVEYCRQDVEVERAIDGALFLSLTPAELDLWILDQYINDYGARIDTKLVRNAIRCDEIYKARVIAEMQKLTGLTNPNSVAQLKSWLVSRDLPAESLAKADAATLAETALDVTVRRVMGLRLRAAKTSVKKYEAMANACSEGERVRGLLQFCGAARTGRWAGRLVQVQNLPRNYMKGLDEARNMLRDGAFDDIEMFYDNVPDVLSQLIRTAFIPSEGNRFIISDFSAIEARVIAWIAGEKWRMDVFNGHGKIYEASASQMFKIPIESITKDSPLRQKGKVAELALGYQGAVGALIQMGALDMGLTETELPGIVNRWRRANPAIVRLWQDAEEAAIKTVLDGKERGIHGLLGYQMQDDFLCCLLPSGRNVVYPYPEVTDDKGFKKLSYMEQDAGQWRRQPTYGGKLTENFVQAVARDCLAYSMLRLTDEGFNIAFHVHDEVVLDVPKGESGAAEVAATMGEPIPWAPGLPLKAAAFESSYYLKD